MSDPTTGLPGTPLPDPTESFQVPWDDDAEDLYQQAPCGYLSTLPDGTIVKVNQTFLNWTGFERSALVGRQRLRDLLTAGGRIYHETHYAPLLRMQDEVHEVAFDVVRADGRRLPTLVNSVLSRDAEGRPRVIRTTIFDATERRGYERELLVARRAAEASERRVSALQGIVAELAAAPTEAGVAAAVVRAPGTVFGAADSRIWLVDADRELLVAAGAGVDGGGEEISLARAEGLAEVARVGQVRVIVPSADARLRFPELADTVIRDDDRTVLLIPLTAVTGSHTGETVLGVLAFGLTDRPPLEDQPRPGGEPAGQPGFTGGELDVARLLGHQAGQALHRARLYDDARRREARATFLAETTRVLDETLRLAPRARLLVSRLVPDIAGWAAVQLLVGPSGLYVEDGSPAPDPRGLADRVAAVVAAGGGTSLTDDGPDADVAVLALAVRGRVLGTLALRLRPGGRTALAEAVFLSELADRAGLALENARLYEQERAIAQTLQRSLLAGDLPADPRFAVETHYQPGTADLEVGGDWYDAFLVAGDKLAVVIGDVVGRGIDAAATMGQLRSAIRALAAAEAGPARLLERLDLFVDRVETARMATVAYGEITLSTSELTYACAGHPPPLVHEPGQSPRYLWGGRSAPLGSRAGRAARDEHRTTLAPGSRLLLYTDGLIERRDRSLDDGFAVLAEQFAARRGAPLPGLAAELATDLVGPEHRDDVCLLCVAMGTEDTLERQIGADPLHIALLRKDLRGWLVSHSVDEQIRQAVLLACSEAVTNSIEHGYRGDPYGVVTLTARVSGDGIEVRVNDRGIWRPADVATVRGRGLRLIRELMDEVTIEHDAGTTVVMRRGWRARPEVESTALGDGDGGR